MSEVLSNRFHWIIHRHTHDLNVNDSKISDDRNSKVYIQYIIYFERNWNAWREIEEVRKRSKHKTTKYWAKRNFCRKSRYSHFLKHVRVYLCIFCNDSLFYSISFLAGWVWKWMRTPLETMMVGNRLCVLIIIFVSTIFQVRRKREGKNYWNLFEIFTFDCWMVI